MSSERDANDDEKLSAELEPVAKAIAEDCSVWPEPFREELEVEWPDLETDDGSIEKWVFDHQKVLIRVVTWNQNAKTPPPIADFIKTLLPRNKYHVYVIGAEECERTIAQSAINPSKKNWESYLVEALGPEYVPLRSLALQATHIIAFVHRCIAPMCSMVRSAAAATGAGNTLGNKGGVAIYMKIGLTSILLVNAHLAAHQDKESQRNLDFDKISKTIPIMLERKELREGSKRNLMNLMGTSARSLAKFGSGNDLRSEEFGMKTATSFGGNGRGSKEVDHVTSVDADLTEEDTILKPVREDSMAGMSLADSKDDRNRLSIDLSQTTTGVNHNESTRRSTPAKSSKTINGGVVENSEEATTELDEKLSYDSDEARDQVPAIIEINSNNDLQERAPLVDANARSFSMGNIDCVSSEAMEGITEMRGIDTQRGIALNSPDRAIKSSHSMDAMNSFKVKSLDDCADIVVFMGDLNYRIKGNRSIIDRLLDNNMHEVMLGNDQLRTNMLNGKVLRNFTEAPLNFRPTYKFAVGSNSYDSGGKNRIPSWTDRILYIDSKMHCFEYDSDPSIMTSDHKPVYASFVADVNFDDKLKEDIVQAIKDKLAPKFIAESQVCTIM